MFSVQLVQRSFHLIVLTTTLLGLIIGAPLQAAQAASIVVNSTTDAAASDGGCALREAIINANNNALSWADCASGSGADTITFAASLGNITLTSDLPQITDSLTVNGLKGATGRQVIDGAGAYRIFSISGSIAFEIDFIEATRGMAIHGGALDIGSDNQVTVVSSVFADNSSNFEGGAIYNLSSELTISHSTLYSNTSNSIGGAIANSGDLTITNSEFMSNTATSGGAICSGTNTSTIDISESNFRANRSLNGTGGAISSSGDSISLDHVVFQSNSADPDSGAAGAVDVYHGLLTLTDSDFISNTAFSSGGLRIDYAGSAIISGTTFIGNHAEVAGALYAGFAPQVTIIASQFLSNTAGDRGGAIFSDNHDITIAGSDFSYNTAYDGGAIMLVESAAMNLTGSSFDHNRATNWGGVLRTQTMLFQLPNLVATNNTFSDNSADLGGVIFHESGVIELNANTFSENTAINDGGAIFNWGDMTVRESQFIGNNAMYSGAIESISPLTVTGSTFALNTAVEDGAICNTDQLLLTNSTFYSNSATSSSGALYSGLSATSIVIHSTFSSNGGTSALYGKPSGNFSMVNSLVTNSDNANCSGTIADGGYNLQYGGTIANSCGVSIPTADPKLGPLAYNGGPTKTMALLPGSAARDQIPSLGGCGVLVTLDQRGVSRPDTSGLCDIGAYELSNQLFMPVVLK